MAKKFKTARAEVARTRHPRRVIYSYPFVSAGREAALYRVRGRGVVHKFWRQDWILANYKMFRNEKRAFAKSAKRAQDRFRTGHDLAPVENTEVPHRGIPIEQFKKITFIMSKTSEDIINQARKKEIPVPEVARAISHPKKDLYILELSDLTKKGHTIVSGNEFISMYTKKVKNAEEIQAGMDQDLKKLKRLGYEQDLDTHPPYSSWLVRINNKTQEAERFLWDPTNLRIKQRKVRLKQPRREGE